MLQNIGIWQLVHRPDPVEQPRWRLWSALPGTERRQVGPGHVHPWDLAAEEDEDQNHHQRSDQGRDQRRDQARSRIGDIRDRLGKRVSVCTMAMTSAFLLSQS